jgi:hypothetical protein
MNRSFGKIVLAFILLFSSLFFLKTPGTPDVNAFLRWAKFTDSYGFVKGFELSKSTHPPFSSIILFTSTKISSSLGSKPDVGIKLSMYFFLFSTVIIFYIVTKDYFLSIISYFLLMISSLGQMYTDIYYTPFLILSLFFLKKRNILLTTIFYCLASQIKPQVIVLMPFITLQIVNISSLSGIRYFDYKKITLNFVLPFVFIYLAMLLIYGKPYINSLQGGHNPPLSALATNIGWIITCFINMTKPQLMEWKDIGWNFIIRDFITYSAYYSILKYSFIITYSIIFIKYFKLKDKSFEKFLLYATAAFLSYFILYTGVHENHAYIPVILLLLLYGEDKNYFMTMLIWGILFNINLILFQGIGGDRTILFYIDYYTGIINLSLLFSFICTAVYFIFILKDIFKVKRLSNW